MGWLKQLMDGATPRVRSYGELARAALEHGDWPDDTTPQPRSLASLLSKLDRSQELEWLADRPAVQHVLADLLNVPRARVAEAVSRHLDQVDRQGHLLRLNDVPFARPIDLAADPLPPGIPEIATRPAMWQRLLWHAPSGSGRSLVGAWLEARSLATFDCGSDFDAVVDRLAPSGALYIELTAPKADCSWLAAPPRDGICVATPVCPDARALSAHGWTVVRSDEPASFARPLIRWLEPRLDRAGEWDADALAAWLEELARSGAAASLGALLGFAGLADTLGLEVVRRAGLDSLAERHVRERIASASAREGARGDFLEEEGPRLLAGLARRLVADCDEPWTAARSVDAWMNLLPAEYQRSVDTEWIRLNVSRSASAITMKEVDRALRRSPPGGFRIVQTLQVAGLLRASTSGDGLMLSPHWLGATLVEAAHRDLLLGSPFEWGEAVLRPHAAGRVAAAIQSRLASGVPVEVPVDGDETDTPAAVAALETCFRLAGLSLLEGADLPAEYTEALWDAQVDSLVHLEDGPHARIEFPDGGAMPELTHGAWLLSALAIAEHLPLNRGRRHLTLRPWTLPSPHDRLSVVLDAVHATVASDAASGKAWARAAFSLARRLSLLFPGELQSHALLGPARAFDAFLSGTLEMQDVARLDGAAAVLSLGDMAAERAVDEAAIFGELFRAWERAGYPELPRAFRSGPAATRLFAHVPADVLARALLAGRVDAESPFTALDRVRHDAVVGAMESGARVPLEALRALPEAQVARLLDGNALLGVEEARVLWARAPDSVLAALRRRYAGEPEWARGVIEGAPVERYASIVALLSAPSPDRARAVARSWAHGVVTRRAPGWRSAYALLSDEPSLES